MLGGGGLNNEVLDIMCLVESARRRTYVELSGYLIDRVGRVVRQCPGADGAGSAGVRPDADTDAFRALLQA